MECHRRCVRCSLIFFGVALSILTIFGFAPILGRMADRLDSLGGRCDRLASADIEIRARLDSLERHQDEIVRIAHDRRKALADELRREMADGLAAVLDAIPAVPAPEVRRAEIAAMLAADIALEAEIRHVARTVRYDDRAILARLRAIEARKPETVKVVERVVERPVTVVQPVQHLYPILPWRCR